MARPHLAPGTHGRVRVDPDPAGFRAVCRYRDGVPRLVQRQAETEGAAERPLAPAVVLTDDVIRWLHDSWTDSIHRTAST